MPGEPIQLPWNSSRIDPNQPSIPLPPSPSGIADPVPLAAFPLLKKVGGSNCHPRSLTFTTTHEALVPEALVPYLSQWRWNASSTEEKPFGVRIERERPRGKKIKIFLHQLVYLWFYQRSPIPPFVVSHIDRNPLNNDPLNLTLRPSWERPGERAVYSNSTSGYRGASYSRFCKRYRSQVYLHSRAISLGYFPTKYEAHLAWAYVNSLLRPGSPDGLQPIPPHHLPTPDRLKAIRAEVEARLRSKGLIS